MAGVWQREWLSVVVAIVIVGGGVLASGLFSPASAQVPRIQG
ncbi:exported hypothetical protein [Nitrospira lenta]|uniref:Uncharacterized protein n=1 Tax=Nitrospira lenta TaxID=1436998 RepID=A0A330LBA8_9BACT|nr:exported hypothetical protein [Nitrospira lenta]